MKIVYFVHDLLDPAVHRRIRMFLWGGADLTLVGFRRGAQPLDNVDGVPAFDLGETTDAQLASRALSVARALIKLNLLADYVREASAVVARNLEMLVLGSRARRRYAPKAKLIYECLDIHRLLSSDGVRASVLRRVEGRLWGDVQLLLTSSPAFIQNYFLPRGFTAPIKLLENKLLVDDRSNRELPTGPPMGPPWRIGWFGVIRCRKSLGLLSSLARAANGAVEVIIAGRPSAAIFPNFTAELNNIPHLEYKGQYRNPIDLPRIYSEIHFSWAIDYYEEGENSAWLLPNRLYEGSFHGAVPIALASVETGRWLKNRRVGVVIDDPVEEGLFRFFRDLKVGGYSMLARQIEALPRTDLSIDRSECALLVKALCS